MQTILINPATKERAKASGVLRASPGEEQSSQHVGLVLNILRIFRDIVDFLVGGESCHDLRLFYLQLSANSLLLSEYIQPLYKLGSATDLDHLARPVLNKLSSYLRSSVIPEYETTLPHLTSFPRLTALEYYWGLSGPREEKVLQVKQCLDLSCRERRDELILLLRGCLATLRSQYPDGSTDGAEEYPASRNKRPKPPGSVWNAANSICEALVACSKHCSSIHNHDYAARLRLATHNKRANDDYCFETFITMNLVAHSWQEALIQAILSDSSPKRQQTVRFALPPEGDASNGGPRPRVAVKRLCEQIAKMKQNPSMRMNLKVEEGRLWKEQSSRSDLPISRSEPALSLEDIMRGYPTNLTEKVKRVLAVFISYSILHLRGTPWLHADRFKASNILFFRTASALPLKPYIHMELRDCDRDTISSSGGVAGMDTEIDPDDLPLHPYPELIMLAIILMELYMKQPIRELAERGGMVLDDWDNIDGNTRYAVAVAAFEFFKAEFPDKYRGSVDKCLDPNIGLDRNDQELDDQGLKLTIYYNIIRPLEDELDSGFGDTLSVENLDDVAQTLDLRAWGQPYRRQSLSNPAEIPGITTVRLPMKRTYPQFEEAHDQTPLSRRETMYSSMSDRSQAEPLSHESYTVGWICALPKEMAASQAMLDENHPSLPQDRCDPNSYTLGRIGTHNVAMACLPAGVTGTIAATRVAQQMLSTFKCIRFGLMVGIGGGVPGSQDIRLGDIVVGEPCDTFGGVIQYDFGKTVENCIFRRTGSLNRPPDVLLTAVSRLRASHYHTQPLLNSYLEKMIQQYPDLSDEFSHPGVKNDLLFNCEYDHNRGDPDGSCGNCDPAQLVPRIARNSPFPHIHYGLIASGNQVMRHGITRDRLRKDLNVLCFEMEAAGLMDIFPCLVIRGICDYADSHKCKTWQGYAAAVAAAYAKELLGMVSGG
ncbi:purine and uridine phosphorylase [Aspergillus cavernicola]|uniref:Purine and uridine phosphorylase n=1 Tax=Aspergillus cavernicola TaxID=176166 RepID=A0ABR4HLG3_9EURO